MKFDQKSPIQIEAERQEAANLAASILDMTSKIPPRIINDAKSNLIRQYKTAATKAISVAQSKSPNLTKLREQHAAIRSFYI